MDGVTAARSVLVADTALVTLVPNYTPAGETAPRSRIIAGPAPLGTPLPFVMLESVSKVDLNIPSPGADRFVTERVQVTVVARNYPEQKAVLRAVRHAAADKLNPAVTGITGITIHTDSAGPDFYDPDYAGWRGSQDFRVKYTEQR
jgi:hypothetical protein